MKAADVLQQAATTLVDAPSSVSQYDSYIVVACGQAMLEVDRSADLLVICNRIREKSELPLVMRMRAASTAADAYVALGQLNQAESSAREGAFRSDNNQIDPEGVFVLAKVLVHAGKNEDAIDILEKSVSFAPFGPRGPQGLLINLLRESGHHKKALSHLTFWIEKGFINTQGMVVNSPVYQARCGLMRALVLLELGRVDQAKAQLQEAALILRSHDAFAEAEERIVKATHSVASERSISSIKNLAAEILNNNWRAVRSEYAELDLVDSTDYERFLAQAQSLKEQGRFAEAAKRFEDTLNCLQDPNEQVELKLAMELGDCHFQAGQYDRAAPYHRRSWELLEKNYGVGTMSVIGSISFLAASLTMQDKLDEALPLHEEAMDRAIRFLGQNNVMTAAVRINYADCLINLERYDDAERELLIAIPVIKKVKGEDDPLLRLAAAYLNRLYTATGQVDEAAEYQAGLMDTASTQPTSSPSAP